MCIYVRLHVCLCAKCMQYVWRSEGGVRFPRTGVPGGVLFATRCEHAEPSLGHLLEQNALVTVESSLQPQLNTFPDPLGEHKLTMGLASPADAP